MDLDTAIQTILENYPILKRRMVIQEVQDKTKRPDGTTVAPSTICYHLESLVMRGIIFSYRGNYSLEPFPGAVRRAQEKHRTEIISGLLALDSGRGKYTVEGDVVPNPNKAEFASQHLATGYSDIAHLSSIEEAHAIFLKRLRRLIEALKLGDEKLKGRCEDCQRRI